MTLDFERPSASPIVPPRQLSIEERFARFVAENPRVIEAIANLAHARRRSGQTSWSMRAAFEILRERVDIAAAESVPGGHHVKLNNSYTALAADLIEARYPDLRGFFRRRSA